jgi:hypothetical protein
MVKREPCSRYHAAYGTALVLYRSRCAPIQNPSTAWSIPETMQTAGQEGHHHKSEHDNRATSRLTMQLLLSASAATGCLGSLSSAAVVQQTAWVPTPPHAPHWDLAPGVGPHQRVQTFCFLLHHGCEAQLMWLLVSICSAAQLYVISMCACVAAMPEQLRITILNF